MSFRRRMIMAANSKPYDAEIEYLESTGTQFIETGIIPIGYDNIFETKITYLGYSTNTQWSPWFIAYTNENSNTYRICRSSDSDSSVLVYNGAKAGGGAIPVSVNIGTAYDIKMYPTYATFNNKSINLSIIRGDQNTSSLKLFNNKGSKLRFYNFKWTKGDNVILDMIPVRVGQVGYMYDKVSGQLFGNSGSGDFVLGNDVN